MTKPEDGEREFEAWYFDNFPNPLGCGHAREARQVWQAARKQSAEELERLRKSLEVRTACYDSCHARNEASEQENDRLRSQVASLEEEVGILRDGLRKWIVCL